MKKYIVMMLFSSFIGIFSNPEILSASNSVAVNGLNESGIVQTIQKPVDPVVDNSTPGTDYTYVEPAYEELSYEEPAYEEVAYVEPMVSNSNEGYGAVPEPEYLSFWVSVYANKIEVSPSYYDIYQTGKLIYGHNTSSLLYDLNYLYTGDVFLINGTKYRVSDRVIYEKTDDYSLNGSRSVMKKLKNSAYGHSVALMTCYGTYYGNGDASHRLVIFADSI